MSVREFTRTDGSPGSFWTKIGSGFTNKDGSIGVQLDAIPLDGRVILQIPLSRDEREARKAQRQQGGGGGGGGGRGWGGQQGGQARGNQGGRDFGGRPSPQQQNFQQGTPPFQPGEDAGDGGDDDGPPY